MSSTQFDGDIDPFVSYLKSNRGLSANTLKAYRADLTACLHLFELRGVTDLNEITLDDLAQLDGGWNRAITPAAAWPAKPWPCAGSSRGPMSMG